MRRRHRLAADPPELNLVPLLDMVSLLIQLMLINAQFGSYAELPGTAATTVAGHPEAGVLALNVTVAPEGYRVAWTEGGERAARELLCSAQPCADPDAWDRAGLQQVAGEIKDRFPDEKQVVITPKPGVPFEVLVATMDALRERPSGAMFPDAVFAGGSR
jgi:biopolymer transport protein ExbD